MIAAIQRIINGGLLRLQRASEVARFEGIILVDTQHGVLFRKTVLSALHLIKDLDERRFHRIRRDATSHGSSTARFLSEAHSTIIQREHVGLTLRNQPLNQTRNSLRE